MSCTDDTSKCILDETNSDICTVLIGCDCPGTSVSLDITEKCHLVAPLGDVVSCPDGVTIADKRCFCGSEKVVADVSDQCDPSIAEVVTK